MVSLVAPKSLGSLLNQDIVKDTGVGHTCIHIAALGKFSLLGRCTAWDFRMELRGEGYVKVPFAASMYIIICLCILISFMFPRAARLCHKFRKNYRPQEELAVLKEAVSDAAFT